MDKSKETLKHKLLALVEEVKTIENAMATLVRDDRELQARHTMHADELVEILKGAEAKEVALMLYMLVQRARQAARMPVPPVPVKCPHSTGVSCAIYLGPILAPDTATLPVFVLIPSSPTVLPRPLQLLSLPRLLLPVLLLPLLPLPVQPPSPMCIRFVFTTSHLLNVACAGSGNSAIQGCWNQSSCILTWTWTSSNKSTHSTSRNLMI